MSHKKARRAIIVGDVHATPTEIRDCQQLIGGLATLRPHADTIIFLGDQFHTHAILHLDVINFWRQTANGLRSLGFKVVALVGNHDVETSGQLVPNAMQSVADCFDVVVDRTTVLWKHPVHVAMPYYHDPQEFVAACRGLDLAENGTPLPSARTLICHQTFDGAQYDNGFYAQDGVDQTLLPFDAIISGHIHTRGTVGKVLYIGSPRWRNLHDVNKHKTVVCYDFETQTVVQEWDTSQWCSKMIHWELTPETERDEPPFDARTRATITLRGPADWVRERAKHYRAQGCAVRQLPDIQAAPRVKESEPVDVSFVSFVRGFQTPHGTPPAVLESLVKRCQNTVSP